MTKEECEQVDDIFDALEENDGAADLELLDAVTKLSAAGKTAFVRRMDERYGAQPPQVH